MDKTKIKWIALAIAVILAFTGIGIVIGLAIQINNPDMSLSLFNSDVLDYEIFNDEGHITLSLAAAGDQDSYTKTITATVLPEDAPMKSVRWFVVWDSAADVPSEDGVVSHYITVTPSSNDSKVATIQCLKPFEGSNILVQCKTDVGGYMATCVIKYVGTPNSLSFDTTGRTIKSFDGWGVNGIELSCGTTASLPLSLDNAMHAVGSTFGNYEVTLEAHGGITYHSVFVGSYGQGTTESDGSANLTTNSSQAYIGRSGQAGFLYILQATIEDGKLKLIAGDSFSAYTHTISERPGKDTKTFTGYIDGKKPYIKVTVTETTSGVSQSINVTTQATVSSLSLSATSIEF